MSAAVVLTPLQLTNAQNQQTGVSILKILPEDSTGTVGSPVNLQGTIYVSNGSYQVVFDKTVVASGRAEGFYVNATFPVPEHPSGSYAIILRDVGINVNNTASFTIEPSYAITPSSASIQEGNSITLNVAATGSSIGAQYSAEVTVVPPTGTQYTKTVSLGAANDKGTASTQVTFPDSSFSPSGSSVDYSGVYNVYLNKSLSLAQNQFSVNILDASTYHRGQTVTVHATGYQPNQQATLQVTDKTGANIDSKQVTASADGIIDATWVVTGNAPLGNCTLKISPQGTQKAVMDSQSFTLGGNDVKIQATNLAGQPVPDVSLQIQDTVAGAVYNDTTGSDGTATFKLENGNYGVTALFNGVNVGATNITVSGSGTFSVRCQLTNLQVTVKNTQGQVMPFVDISVSYQGPVGGAKTGYATAKTGASGTCVLPSLLAGATFTVNASLYGQVFNLGANTFSSVPAQATSDVVIVAPDENISLNVVGYNQQAIPNARVELVELTTGMFYAGTTDSNGALNAQVTFGMYRARVYVNNILVDETTIDAFSSSQTQIHSTIYGIDVKVAVVDFFGSPIANANVTLNGPATETYSAVTKGDGTATFSNIIGGDMQIVAQASGTPESYQAVRLNVNQPTTVQIKMERYVAFGSMLVQASVLIAVIIILAGAILFAVIELLVWRRHKRVHAAAV